jgi:regulator of sigma E protease
VVDILSFLNNLWPYLVAVLVFLVLIIIHEFGHFIAAKLFGVKVNEFAVGFGPKLFSKQGKETLYRFNLVPFGGYCAMEGEDETSEDKRAFCNQRALKRLIITAMGAIFNLLLGILLVAIILSGSKMFTTSIVAQFDDNAVSQQSGLAVNDEIIEIDGRRIYSYMDLSYAFTAVDDGKLDILVKRDGEKVLLKDVTFNTETEDGIAYVDLDFKVYGEKKTVGSYIKHTFKTTFSYCRVVWFSLVDLISGKFGISAVSGPVGVTATIGNAAKESLLNLLPIMALITINLGVFNLLPVPALDGGRIFFIFVEMIIRKPIPKKFEGIVHGVGLALLLLIMLLITFKDIIALFT